MMPAVTLNTWSKQKVEFICECGQKKVTTYKVGIRSKNCKECWRVGLVPGTKIRNLTLINNINGNKKSDKVDWQCDCGNIKSIVIKSVLNGYTSSCGCKQIRPNVSSCDKRSLTKIGLESLFNKQYGCLTIIDQRHIQLHTGSDTKVLTQCSCGKQKMIMLGSITRGNTKSCGECGFDNIKSGTTFGRLTLTSDVYGSQYSEKEVTCLCSCGNTTKVRIGHLLLGKISSCGCTVNQLRNKIRKLYSNARLKYKLNNYTYDAKIDNLLIECRKLSVNMCHSRKTDKKKRDNAIVNGYKYIMLYEDEITKGLDKVKSYLNNILNIGMKIKIRPQKLIVSSISSKEGNQFLDKYHYLGKCSGKQYFAAHYQDILVAIMVFSCPVRQNTQGIELKRYCVHPDYKIIGLGASMLKRIMTQLGLRPPIISYSDNRLHDGKLYQHMGFVKQHEIKQDYYWVKGNKRYHKSSLRKPKGCPITETELRQSEGYHKIHDLGKTKWVYNHLSPNISLKASRSRLVDSKS